MEKEKKRLRLEVYHPKKKLGVSKQGAFPFLVRLGGCFVAMGGIISFVMSSAIMGARSIFNVKQKVYNKAMPGRKYIELKIKKR